MLQAILGALVMACGVAGLLFLRFWKLSRDRLFLFFCLAFWVFGLQWLCQLLLPVTAHPLLYLLRLGAFLALIAGIVDKNRRSRTR